MAPRVSSYYRDRVYVVSPNDTLAAARNMMIRHGIRRLVVIDEQEKPIGILTASDILSALMGRYQSVPLDSILVGDVMSRDVITIEPTKSIKTAAKLMIKHNIGGLPVVDPTGKLIGIITKTDMLRAFYERFKGAYKVADLMRHAYATAKPTHTIFHLVKILPMDPSRKIIIVDDNGVPVGVVTEWDLANASVPLPVFMMRGKDRFRKIKGPDRYRDKIVPFRQYLVPLAENIMTEKPLTTVPDEDAAEAARIMYENKIGVLPVVDNEGKLLGIITKREYLIAIARS